MSDTAVLLIHGFMQPDHISDGLGALHDILAGLGLGWLRYVSWNTRPKKYLAEFERYPRRVIVGHSFGAWRASVLPPELELDAVFSCDGVSRERPRVLRFGSQVKQLYAWRRVPPYVDKLVGKLIEPSPIVYAGDSHLVEVVGVPHAQMDEHEPFQRAVLEYLR